MPSSPPPVSIININSTDPPAPDGQQNIVFTANAQGDISAHDALMVGDTGTGGLAGNVPTPAAGDATAHKFLKADGTWEDPGTSSGAQGNQGNQGATGTSGPQGNQGNQGSAGFIGSDGAPGPQGNQGNQGSAGFIGSNGAQGNQGSPGPQGNQGTTGSGSQGNQGTQGASGPQGFQGPAGSGGGGGGSSSLFSVVNELITTSSHSTLFSLAGIAAGNYYVMMYYRVLDPGTFSCDVTYDDGGVQNAFLTAGYVTTGSYRTVPLFVTIADGSTLTVATTSQFTSNVYVSISVTQA